MISASGNYFDGISSKPQEIELQLDELRAELQFNISAGNTYRWAIGDLSFQHIGNSLEIRCKHHSLALIKVNDDVFAAEFISYLQAKGQISWYQRVIRMGIKTHLSIAILILGVIVAGYLLAIPWVAEKAVTLIPQHFDISMGHKFYSEYLQDNSIDTAKTEALNQFAKQLKLQNTQELHFTVINSPTVNAFALPDGNIIVFTGIIRDMTNYDELAGLIGHEVSHVNNRHSMKMLCRNLSGYLFISAVFSDVNGIMAIIGDNIHNLQSLSYSRQFEQQADEQGIDLMILNGINPRGMTDLFSHLQSGEKVVIPAFISSHPITTDRIDYINRRINNNSHQYLLNPALERLFRQIKK